MSQTMLSSSPPSTLDTLEPCGIAPVRKIQDTRSLVLGIAAALLAGAIWSLNFAAPRLIGGYSSIDLGLVRFIIAAIVALGVLKMRGVSLRHVPRADLWMTFWLGAIGYVGYFFAVTGALAGAGSLLPPLIISLVPIVLSLIGFRHLTPATRRRLVLPLGLVALGLFIVNSRALDGSGPTGGQPYVLVGIAASFMALALWIGFALLNESALNKRPGMDAVVWAATISVGSGVATLVLLPLALWAGALEIPRLGLFRTEALPLLGWGAATGVLCSLVGSWAWTFATQRVPGALTAHLMMSEVVFAIILGSIIDGKLPSLTNSSGAAVLIVGVSLAVHVFQSMTPNKVSADRPENV